MVDLLTAGDSRTGANRTFPFHYETGVLLDATPEIAFAYLDDFRKLSMHMEKSSPMMMGSRMRITGDAGEGRAIGSSIRMEGRVLGLTLSLDEVVIRRNPPWEKAWRTLGAKLVVIGRYELGFVLSARGTRSWLRVFIDYELPATPWGSWLGRLFGGMYARWCVRRMAGDAAAHFGSPIAISRKLPPQ